MQQDRDRRHAHPPESYAYRPSSDYVPTRSPPYPERMAPQYQQPARLSEPYFRGSPAAHPQRHREESHHLPHVRRFEQSPSRTESFPRPEPRDHPPTQGSRPYWDAARDDHLRPLPPPIQYRDSPRQEPTLSFDRPYSRRPDPGFGHRGGERLPDIPPPRPPAPQSTYVSREPDRPPAWIPSSPPRQRPVSWSERPRQAAHEDWNRPSPPPRPHFHPPPTTRWSYGNVSTNPRWEHSRAHSASLDNRRFHSRTPTDVRTQAPWDGQAPLRPRSPVQETISRNFHRTLVHEVPPSPSARDFYEVQSSARSAAPRPESRGYAQPAIERFREPLPRPPSARRDDSIPFTMPLPTDLARERPTSSHGSNRSQNYQDSPYTRTVPPPPPRASFSPAAPFSAGPPRQGRDRAPSRASNTLPTPPVAAGLPPRPQSALSWPKENAKPPSRAPSYVELTRPDVRHVSDPHGRRRSFQLSPSSSPSSAGPEQMVQPLGWLKKQVRPTPPVSALYTPRAKRSPGRRLRLSEIPRPFAESVPPPEVPQDRPMSETRYRVLSGTGISHESFAQERSPEVSISRSFPHKHPPDTMMPNTSKRRPPEVLRNPEQQSGMNDFWGKPDPPRLSTGSPIWAQLDRTGDTDTSPILPEPPHETPINHGVIESPSPIEEQIKSESPPVAYRHISSDEPRAWQGASRTLRRAAEERILDQELPILRKAMVQWIYADNHAIAATNTSPSHGQTFSRQDIGFDGRPITPQSRGTMIHALSMVFTAEEESQQQKIWRLKEQYRRLAHRWTRHCRELDDGNLPIEIEEAEPFLGRGNRRNRLEFVRTDYEAEQAVERLQDLARYDAVLLGRINAATVPDMVSVASRSSHLPKFHDTNGDILNPEAFYDYEHVDHWTQEEVDAFHAQMEIHGKRFGLIASHPALKKKTPQDCVRYYYMEKADDKFRALLEPRNRKTVKRTTRSSTTTQAGPGGIMADIEKMKERGRAVATDMEVDETDDSAYEAESAPRRGRGRGRGRGGWRGRGRGGQISQRQQRESTAELEGDNIQDTIPATPTELTATQLASLTFGTLGEERPPGRKPPFPLLTKSRKRKGREGDDGELSVDSPSVSAFGSGVAETPTPVVKRQISSYWHVADRERIKSLLNQHGENWEAIANVLSQKSANQVRNYVRGKPELLNILEERKLQTQPTDHPPLWVNGSVPVTNSHNGTPARSPSISR